MRLAEVTTKLRDTSERYGGIQHYLAAAGALDRACSQFLKEQTEETLADLVGAHAAANRCTMQIAAGVPLAPVEEG